MGARRMGQEEVFATPWNIILCRKFIYNFFLLYFLVIDLTIPLPDNSPANGNEMYTRAGLWHIDSKHKNRDYLYSLFNVILSVQSGVIFCFSTLYTGYINEELLWFVFKFKIMLPLWDVWNHCEIDFTRYIW